MVSLLTFLPVIITLLAALSILSQILITRQKLNFVCQSHTMATQFELANLLHRLLQLNPKAERLRKKRTIAEKNLKIALASHVAPAIAATRAHLSAVIAMQVALRKEQQSLLNQSKSVIYRFKQIIPQKLAGAASAEVQNVQIHQPHLAVSGLPLTSLTPSYHPLPFFSQLQKAHINWGWSIKTFEGPLLEFKNIVRGLFPGHCAATIKKENNKWYPALSI